MTKLIVLGTMIFLVSCYSPSNLFPTHFPTKADENHRSLKKETTQQNRTSLQKESPLHTERINICLAILPQSQKYPKEVENLCNLIHNNIHPYISLVLPPTEHLPTLILPNEISIYQQLFQTSANYILYVDVSFEQRDDPAVVEAKWIYATAHLEIQESVDKKVVWKTDVVSSEGILNWQATNITYPKILEICAKDSKEMLIPVIQNLPSGHSDKIRIITLTDSPKTLQIWQNEILRLEKAKHFRVGKNVFAMSCMMAIWAEYSGNPLALKSLFEEALSSLSMVAKIHLTEKIMILEIEERSLF